MSRKYKMTVHVNGIQENKIKEVVNYLVNKWFSGNIVVDNENNHHEKYSRYVIKDIDGYETNIIKNNDENCGFSITQENYLNDSESEKEFSDDIYSNLKRINEKHIELLIRATCLENLPFEDYWYGI